jgi:hypothetical protein
VRLQISDISVTKTSSLQPYLLKLLQAQDATARVSLTIDVDSSAGLLGSPAVLVKGLGRSV